MGIPEDILAEQLAARAIAEAEAAEKAALAKFFEDERAAEAAAKENQ